MKSNAPKPNPRFDSHHILKPPFFTLAKRGRKRRSHPLTSLCLAAICLQLVYRHVSCQFTCDDGTDPLPTLRVYKFCANALVWKWPCSVATQGIEYWDEHAHGSATYPAVEHRHQLSRESSDSIFDFYTNMDTGHDELALKASDCKPGTWLVNRKGVQENGSTTIHLNQYYFLTVCTISAPASIYTNEAQLNVGIYGAVDRTIYLVPYHYNPDLRDDNQQCANNFGTIHYSLQNNVFPDTNGWTYEFSNQSYPQIVFSYPDQDLNNLVAIDQDPTFTLIVSTTVQDIYEDTKDIQLGYCALDKGFTVIPVSEWAKYIVQQPTGMQEEYIDMPQLTFQQNCGAPYQSTFEYYPSTFNAQNDVFYVATASTSLTRIYYNLDVMVDHFNEDLFIEATYLMDTGVDQYAILQIGFALKVLNEDSSAFTICNSQKRPMRLKTERVASGGETNQGLIRQGQEHEDIVTHAYFGQTVYTPQDLFLAIDPAGGNYGQYFDSTWCVQEQHTSLVNYLILRIKEADYRDWVTFDNVNQKVNFEMSTIEAASEGGRLDAEYTLTVELCESLGQNFCIPGVKAGPWNTIVPITFKLITKACNIEPSPQDLFYVRQVTQSDIGLANPIVYDLEYGPSYDFQCPKLILKVRNNINAPWIDSTNWSTSEFSYLEEVHEDDGNGHTKHQIVFNYKDKPQAELNNSLIFETYQPAQNQILEFHFTPILTLLYQTSDVGVDWSSTANVDIATPYVEIESSSGPAFSAHYTRTVTVQTYPQNWALLASNYQNTHIIAAQLPTNRADYSYQTTIKTWSKFESIARNPNDASQPQQQIYISAQKVVKLYACGEWSLPTSFNPIVVDATQTYLKLTADDSLVALDTIQSDLFSFSRESITTNYKSVIYKIKDVSAMVQEILTPLIDGFCGTWEMKIAYGPTYLNHGYMAPYTSLEIQFADLVDEITGFAFQLKNEKGYETNSAYMHVQIAMTTCANENIPPTIIDPVLVYRGTSKVTVIQSLTQAHGFLPECFDNAFTKISHGSLKPNVNQAYAQSQTTPPGFKQIFEKIPLETKTPANDNEYEKQIYFQALQGEGTEYCGYFALTLKHKNKAKQSNTNVKSQQVVIANYWNQSNSGFFWQIPYNSNDLTLTVQLVKQQSLEERVIKFYNDHSSCLTDDDYKIEYVPQFSASQKSRWTVIPITINNEKGTTLELTDTTFWTYSVAVPVFEENFTIRKEEFINSRFSNVPETHIIHSDNSVDSTANVYTVSLQLYDCVNGDFYPIPGLSDVLDLQNNSAYDSDASEFAYENINDGDNLYEIFLKSISQNYASMCGTYQVSLEFDNPALISLQNNIIDVHKDSADAGDVTYTFNIKISNSYTTITISDIKVHFVDCMDQKYATVPSNIANQYTFTIGVSGWQAYRWEINDQLLPPVCSLETQVVCTPPVFSDGFFCPTSINVRNTIQKGTYQNQPCQTTTLCSEQFYFRISEGFAGDRYVRHTPDPLNTIDVSPQVEGEYNFDVFQYNPNDLDANARFSYYNFKVTLKVDCNNSAVTASFPNSYLLPNIEHQVGPSTDYPVQHPLFQISHPISCPESAPEIIKVGSANVNFEHGIFHIDNSSSAIRIENTNNLDAQNHGSQIYVMIYFIAGTDPVRIYGSNHFQIELTPNCLPTQVTMANTQLSSQIVYQATVNAQNFYQPSELETIRGINKIDRVKYSESFDDVSCGGHYAEYFISQVGYDQGEHNSFLMALQVDNESVQNPDMQQFSLHFIATSDSTVQTHELPTPVCSLLYNGVQQCEIEFKILIKSLGGPYQDFIDAKVVYSTECLFFAELAIRESETCWSWDASSQNLVAEGYTLRQDPILIAMPWISLTLPSGQNVIDRCGPITYHVTAENTSWFTCQTLASDPTKPSIVVSSTDQYLVSDSEADAYSTTYSLNVIATLSNYSQTAAYWSDSLSQDSRKNGLKFTLNDPCLAIQFSPETRVAIKEADQTDYVKQNYLTDDPILTKVLLPRQEIRIKAIRYSVYQIPIAPLSFCGAVSYSFDLNVNAAQEDMSIFERRDPFIFNNNWHQFYLYADRNSQEGIHYLTIQVQMLDLQRHNFYNTKLTFEVDPCEVVQLEPSTQQDLTGDVFLEIGGNRIIQEMNEFYQQPACNKTQSFDLVFIEEDLGQQTADELEATIQSTQKAILESNSPAQVKSFSDQQMNNIYYVSGKYVSFNIPANKLDLLNKKFKVLLVGYFPADSFTNQRFLTSVGLPFTVELIEPKKKENSAPYFIGALPSLAKIPIDKEWSLVLGQVNDDDQDNISLSSTSGFFSQNGSELNWGQILLAKKESEEYEVSLTAQAPKDQLGFQGQFVLKFVDDNVDSQSSQTLKIDVLIVEETDLLDDEANGDASVSNFDGVQIGAEQSRRNKNLPAPQFTINAPDSSGVFDIKFDQPVVLPGNIQQYLQEQEAIEIQYSESEQTREHLLEQEIQQSFEWQVVQVRDDLIKIKLLFSHKEKVSISRFNLDELTIKVQSLSAIVGRDSQKPVLVSRQIQRRKIPQIFTSEQQKQTIQAADQTMKGSLQAFVSMNAASSLIFSTSFSFLWGLINSVQIVVMPVLYYLPDLPININTILVSLYQLATFDLLDSVFEPIFNKDGDESYSDTFEQAGMEGQNFISLVGLIIPLFALYLMWIVIHKILRYLFHDQTWVGPRFARILKQQRYSAVIIRFILESCIDLLISCIICLSMQHNDTLFTDGNQFISLTLAYLTLIGLIMAPIYLIRAAKIHNRQVLAKQTYLPFEDLFENLNAKRINSLFYNTVFFLRRYSIVSVCMMTRNGQMSSQTTFVQVWIFQLLSIASLIFMLHVRPFDGSMTNQSEIFNEYMVLVTGYHLLLFTPFVYYANQQKWGWSFFTVISIMAIFNIAIMMRAQFREVKLKFKKRVNLRKYRQQQEKEQQEKIEFMIRHQTYDEWKQQQEVMRANQVKLEAQKKIEARKQNEKEQRAREIREGLSDVSLSQESSILSFEPNDNQKKKLLTRNSPKEEVSENLLIRDNDYEKVDPLKELYSRNGAKFNQMELERQRYNNLYNQGNGVVGIGLSRNTTFDIGRFYKPMPQNQLNKTNMPTSRQEEIKRALKTQLEKQKKEEQAQWTNERYEKNNKRNNHGRVASNQELLTSRHQQSAQLTARNSSRINQNQPNLIQPDQMSYRSSMIDYEGDLKVQKHRYGDRFRLQNRDGASQDELVANMIEQQSLSPKQIVGNVSEALTEQQIRVENLQRELERQKQIALDLSTQKELEIIRKQNSLLGKHQNAYRQQNNSQQLLNRPATNFESHWTQNLRSEKSSWPNLQDDWDPMQDLQSASKLTRDHEADQQSLRTNHHHYWGTKTKPKNGIEYQPIRKNEKMNQEEAPGVKDGKEQKDVDIYYGAATARIIRRYKPRQVGRRKE